MPKQPVILLTFTNDPGNYLPKIVEEQKAIKNALLDAADRNYLQVRDLQRATAEEIFYLINRYNHRVHIFHYGGHADGQSLQLEKEIGVVQAANVKGIAGLLGTQKGLKLVFLNGCASRGQVKALLDSGVPAVIATRVSIRDDQAKDFATQFYQALAAGSTIREAFRKARAFLEAREGAPAMEEVEATRGILLPEADEQIPWGLYWKAGATGVLEEKLPAESLLEVDFGETATNGRPGTGVNSLLVDTTLRAIKDSQYVKELARRIIEERSRGDKNRKPTDAEKKDSIVRSYPAPVSVQLRALFSRKLAEKYDEDRLRQLATAYQKGMQFLSFLMLSDIWDATQKLREPLQLEEAERLQLSWPGFLGLGD